MNMTEPCSTGIGGDMFVLYYDAKTKKVSAMNGSGRAGAKCTLEAVRSNLKIPDGQVGKIPMTSVHAVTVPGAAAGWADTVERFGSGKVSLAEVMAPAAQLGEEGFPVSEMTAAWVCFPSSQPCLRSCTDQNSGRAQRTKSATPPPTSARCSRTTPAPKTASAAPRQAR
jgi:gamma-glutamyltranspeptidase/glutathione hydrolase